MSYSTMIAFNADGTHGEYVEFRNAWGLHARIWEILSRHLSGGGHWLSMGADGDSALWELHARSDVPADERIVMAATYDRVWIPAELVPRVAESFRSVAARHPAGSAVCHLDRAADAMESAIAKGSAGVGFWGISVAENPWEEWDEEKDEAVYLGPPDGTPINQVVPDLFAPTLA